MKSTDSKPKPHVRWMIRRDLCECVCISRDNGGWRRCDDDFFPLLRQARAVGYVAEMSDGVIGGYALVVLHKQFFYIEELYVNPDYLLRGVATALMGKFTKRLSPDRRTGVVFDVSEFRMEMHTWLRHRGFKAIGVERGYYDNGRDAYTFEYRLPVGVALGR